MDAPLNNLSIESKIIEFGVRDKKLCLFLRGDLCCPLKLQRFRGIFWRLWTFQRLWKNCPKYPELLNLTASFGDSGVSGGFSGDSGT
jgi:hypothetical protein